MAAQAPILIASDSSAEAEIVELVLKDDFDNIHITLDPAAAVQDVQRHRSVVLLLAFKDLQKAEDFYLGLYRHGNKLRPPKHRAVILCSKETVRLAYERCRRGLFDDYVVFWPVTDDVPRLLMSVYRALDDLQAMPCAEGLDELSAAQARELLGLEGLLFEQFTAGQQHIASTERAVAGVEDQIDTALESLAERLRGALQTAVPQWAGRDTLADMIDHCRSESLLPQLRKVNEALQPLTQWADSVQQAVVPYLQCARSLGFRANSGSACVLVVDDDQFQRQLTARILDAEGYQLEFAASGLEAMEALTRRRADLILMDFQMSDMNGIEVTSRIKSNPRFAAIPVIMITGNSEREVVLQSVRHGAADFLVKPYDRNTLVAKVSGALKPELSAEHG